MIPFVGGSYLLNVRKADVQRSVNLFPVGAEVPGSKGATYLDSVPGLTVFSGLGGYLLQENGFYLLTEASQRILL